LAALGIKTGTAGGLLLALLLSGASFRVAIEIELDTTDAVPLVVADELDPATLEIGPSNLRFE
jgi:hypothetical protein